jgi:hypothetical protein
VNGPAWPDFAHSFLMMPQREKPVRSPGLFVFEVQALR